MRFPYVAWQREKQVKRAFPSIRSCELNGSEINWIISGREAGSIDHGSIQRRITTWLDA